MSQLSFTGVRPLLYGTDALGVRKADRCEVDWMIRRHYIHKWPGVTVAILGLYAHSEPVGVTVFALPPVETYVRYGGLTWELARLWVDDNQPRNTESWFISRAIRYVKHHHRDVKAIVSYADPSAGHTGTVYRAANWEHDGMTDHDRTTPRFDYRVVGGKTYSRHSHLPDGVSIERIPRVPKHRYVWRLR